MAGNLTSYRIHATQLILAILITAFLACFGKEWGFSYAELGYGLFAGPFTILLSSYFLVTTKMVGRYQNSWATLGLDLLGLIIWIVAFTVLTALAVNALSMLLAEYYSWKRDDDDSTWDWSRALLAVAAAFSFVEAALFATTLILGLLDLRRQVQSSSHHHDHDVEMSKEVHRLDTKDSHVDSKPPPSESASSA